MTVLIAAAKDLRDRLRLLGFPLIGEAVVSDVRLLDNDSDGYILDRARHLLAEGERLATRLQGERAALEQIAGFTKGGRDSDNPWAVIHRIDGSALRALNQPAPALDGKEDDA